METATYKELLGSYWPERKHPRKGDSMHQTAKRSVFPMLHSRADTSPPVSPHPLANYFLASPSSHCSIPVPTLPGDVDKEIAQERGNGFSKKFYVFVFVFLFPKREATQSEFDVVWLTKVGSRVQGWTSHTHISGEQKWEQVLGRSKKHHHGLA